MFSKKTETRASSMIANELESARKLLHDRNEDLNRAKKHVLELEGTCVGLLSKIRDLEHDQKALDRGYIAIMCDNKQADAVT